MKPTVAVTQNSIALPSIAGVPLSRLTALWQLSKPRVTLLVWLSALAAMWLPGTSVSLALLFTIALGVWLVVASANGWNQVLEWRYDAWMKRTAHRPIPSGRLSVAEAAAVSTLWGVSGVLVLWLFANPLTAMLGAFALLSYVLAYTPAKRLTAWCTVIGAVPGVEGAFVATGHGPAGLLLGPYTGKVVAEVMLGRSPEVDLTPFRPDRFASAGRS